MVPNGKHHRYSYRECCGSFPDKLSHLGGGLDIDFPIKTPINEKKAVSVAMQIQWLEKMD